MPRYGYSAFSELEPAAMGAIVAVETLMDEARSATFNKPVIKVGETPFFSNAARTIEIDRDHDGKADGFVKVDSLSHMALDKLHIDRDGDGRMDFTVNTERNLWGMQRMTIDKDNDGKIDMTMKVNRDWAMRITSLEVDKDNDGKVDAIINLNHVKGAPGLQSILVDRTMQGLSNVYFDVKRDSKYQPTLK